MSVQPCFRSVMLLYYIAGSDILNSELRMRDCNCKGIKTAELFKIIAAAASARHHMYRQHISGNTDLLWWICEFLVVPLPSRNETL